MAQVLRQHLQPGPLDTRCGGGAGAKGEDGAGLRGKHSALRKVTTRGQRAEAELHGAWRGQRLGPASGG